MRDVVNLFSSFVSAIFAGILCNFPTILSIFAVLCLAVLSDTIDVVESDVTRLVALAASE